MWFVSDNEKGREVLFIVPTSFCVWFGSKKEERGRFVWSVSRSCTREGVFLAGLQSFT
jgi:hypothetical protein